MAFYQQTRTAKAAAIGTIMPWTGGVSNIPKGWILCDGTPISAASYPLLARAIGDTYNNGPSSFGGSFPNYAGNIVLPNLTNKNLIDIETSYFGAGGTGETQDLDPKAATAVTPLIGANTDNGIRTIYNDVTTDVVFTLNDRTGYIGRASGNTIGGGEGISKTVYLSPRKLGRDHIKAHNHPGRYETISYGNPLRPGRGVIPHSNFSFDMQSYVDFSDGDPFVNPSNDTEVGATIFEIDPNNVPNSGPATRDAVNGFGSGSPGRVVAGVHAENPSVNYTPFNVRLSPLQPILTNPRVDDANPIPYGLQGANINLPPGAKNYYPDITGTISQANTYDTLMTPEAFDFNQITQSPGINDVIAPHVHDEFDVTFVRGTLRPNTTLTVDVEAPNANLSLDNQANQAALQINFNTAQPGLTCIYIIRAY